MERGPRTDVEKRASLGSGAIVLGGVRIGAGATFGAGAVVTRDVPPRDTVAGQNRPVHLRWVVLRTTSRDVAFDLGEGHCMRIALGRETLHPETRGSKL